MKLATPHSFLASKSQGGPESNPSQASRSDDLPNTVLQVAGTIFMACVLVFAALSVCAGKAGAGEAPKFVKAWGSLGGGATKFNHPIGIAASGSDILYVADSENHRIQKTTADGGFIGQIGSEGKLPGQLRYPSDVAVGPKGGIWVADEQNNRIQRFDPTTGLSTLVFGSKGSGEGQFDGPYGIAVDKSANVYVVDTGNNRIQKFSPEGKFLTKWGGKGSGNGKFQLPMDIATDQSGAIYVADTWNHRIQRFSPDGKFITKWGSEGAGDGQFSAPIGIATDDSGDVYVGNGHRIQKFSPDGAFLSKWGTEGSGDGQFSEIWGIAADQSGDIYVSDIKNQRIQKFSYQPGPSRPGIPESGKTVNPIKLSIKGPRKLESDKASHFTVKMTNTGQESLTNLRFRFIGRGVARRFQQRVSSLGNLQPGGTRPYTTGLVFLQPGKGSLTVRAKSSIGGSNPATVKFRVRQP